MGLPRRKCDDCGKSYKPTRPNARFCSDNCRKAFHRNSGAYRKLRELMKKFVTNQFDQVNAEIKELRRLWSETESRFVQSKGTIEALQIQLSEIRDHQARIRSRKANNGRRPSLRRARTR